MKTALKIAGYTFCEGAGIQVDIRTMMTHGIYAMSAFSALTARKKTGLTGTGDTDDPSVSRRQITLNRQVFLS